ncbi:kinase-like domain-containing protein [Cokeromyces recurvatus]|uniref:kinase-like domain-containing protein n=1 Tax=Cokeromyces recurvatus TaxID=90255 RepID=UPI00222093B7|nr:kinase-like domain-containing protein [Cokeromyces recurvatus]KAI7898021.1 kinase-like domain-containing protein [Cokeromyces recurvatus]
MTVSEEKPVNNSARRRSSVVSTKATKDGLTRKHSERHQVMQIQNYIIYRKTIGAGSMGKVKLAECLDDIHKQKYAVKIMPKMDPNLIKLNSNKPRDPKDTPEEREQRTIREMAIMRLLRHPNICQLKEYISEGDKYYMFLEYVDGGQLLDYIIKNGKLREKLARKFSRQIISAIDYCHRNSIVHRDLKIENILITRTEQLKIIDFGLSNLYSPTQQLDTFCGSLYFAAPELLNARQYTGPEVDVWSFGVVLYVLVCGKVPFDDSNLPALHEKIKTGVIEEYPEHLGKECVDLLSRIFVVDPGRRITLTGIKAHPWMNKGYEEPIRNYLPRREPLERIDMEIIQGMDGFGLGNPSEIKEKLTKIISFPAYQEAALKIVENYQISTALDDQLTNKSRWRRSLSSTVRKKKLDLSDDFQSLPAMYDPLISIYYLVKERKETEERKKQLLSAPSAPKNALSRSTSTFVTGRKSNHSSSLLQDFSHVNNKMTLTRRRTYDASKKLPALPPFTDHSSNSSHLKTKQSSSSSTTTTTATTTAAAAAAAATLLLRKKSLQAVKKLGIIRSPTIKNINHENSFTNDEDTTTKQSMGENKAKKPSSSSIPFTTSSSTTTATTTSSTTNESQLLKTRIEYNHNLVPSTNLIVAARKKARWLKLDFKQNTTLSTQEHQSTIHVDHPKRPSWKRLSMHRKNSTQLSLDPISHEDFPNSYLSPTSPTHHHHHPIHPIEGESTSRPIVMTTSISEFAPHKLKKSNSPSSSSSLSSSSSSSSLSMVTTKTSLKSIFQFNNRNHLFRMSRKELMENLEHVLYQLGIEILSTEGYQVNCSCKRYVIDHYIPKEDKEHKTFNYDHQNILFFILIYEARWARGKIGIKIKEHIHHNGLTRHPNIYSKQVFQNLYHDILDQIEAKSKKEKSKKEKKK